METSVPGIYAAGDCCEEINLQTGKTAVIGLWANAAMQGACAGADMAGDHADCPGNILHNITRFFDMDFISLGDITLPGCKHLFDCPEFFVSLVMDGNTLQSVNVVGNYRVSGILKHHLVKQLTGGHRLLPPLSEPAGAKRFAQRIYSIDRRISQLTELERLQKAKIPCPETGIEIRHTVCDICTPGPQCGIDAFIKDGKVIKLSGGHRWFSHQ